MVNLAAAVLLAVALAAVRKNAVNRAHAGLAVGVTTGLYVASGLAIIVWYTTLLQQAALHGIALPSWWLNLDILKPLGLAISTGLWLLIAAGRYPRAAAIGVAVLVATDLVIFGQRFEWRFASVMLPPSTAETTVVQNQIRAAKGRLLPIDGVLEPLAPWTPILNEVYRIASASSYTPLLTQRYQAATGVTSSGQFDYSRLNEPLLKVLGITSLTTNPGNPLRLNAGCAPIVDRDPVTIRVLQPMAANRNSYHLASRLLSGYGG